MCFILSVKPEVSYTNNKASHVFSTGTAFNPNGMQTVDREKEKPQDAGRVSDYSCDSASWSCRPAAAFLLPTAYVTLIGTTIPLETARPT